MAQDQGPGTRFENVVLVTNEQFGTGPKGVLMAEGDSLKFESPKGMMVMPNVHNIKYTGQLRVEYGEEGTPVRVVKLLDNSRGRLHFRAATKQLEANLRSSLSMTPMSRTQEVEVGRAQSKRGRIYMIVGGVLFLAGVIISAVTYSNASSSSSGGTYIVAYGPVIFGIILFIQGVVESRSGGKRR